MNYHLIKLCVGVEKIEEIHAYQQEKLQNFGYIFHQTRNFPRRDCQGSSLYWVVKSKIIARQAIKELRPHFINDIRYCLIILDSQIHEVMPTPWRAFQGWRYLSPEIAPADIHSSAQSDAKILKDMGVY